jgi:hypothetical protein
MGTLTGTIQLDTAGRREAARRQSLWVGVPWFVWASAASVSCAVFGLHFDIAWHRSIGRDSFWNPAHDVMYSSGVIAAIFCGYLIYATTFGEDRGLRDHSVRILGLRAPFGVFVAAWGGLGVLYDAIFDNWWHNAYGLDVRFTSPPHLLFSLSLWFEMLGSMMLVLSYLNRSREEGQFNAKRLQWILLYMGALIATAQLFACFAYTWDTKLHMIKAYIAVGIFLPVSLAMMAKIAHHRWSCTIMTAIYSAILIALILILPLFPATPRLGPIYAPVTHFIPPRFPLLVIFPAIALDLLWQRRYKFHAAVDALLSGVLFTAVFFAVEWPFANFLLSTASDNRFFGTRYIGFDDTWSPVTASYWQFTTPQHGLHLIAGLAVAALCSAMGIYAGKRLGGWMSDVRR